MSDQLYDLTTTIQQECHKMVEGLLETTKGDSNVQDATNVFFFRKLAELQLMMGTEKHYGYWQLCPKCEGEGGLWDNTHSTNPYRTCPVCNGEKKLVRPGVK